MDRHLFLARQLTSLLDTRFSVFGVRFGLDPILGVFPGGDAFGALISLYLLWIGYQLRVSKRLMIRMLLNVAADYLIGFVPVLGDIADIWFKANVKNLDLLESYRKYGDIEEGEIIR